MMPIFAIAWNTFQEALRSKVLYIGFALFGLLAFMLPLLPSLKEPESKLILVNTTCFHLCFYFSLVIVVFTSASMFSDEVQSKRIYTILTKPVSRLAYIIGKVLGIFLLSYCLMTLMAIILIFFVYATYGRFDEASKLASKGYFSTIDSYTPSEVGYFLRDRKLTGEYACDKIVVRYNGVNPKDFSFKFSALMLLNFSTFDHDDHLHADVLIRNLTEQKSEKLLNVKFKNIKISTVDIPKQLISVDKKIDIEIQIEMAKENLGKVGSYFCKQQKLLLHKSKGSFVTNVFKLFWGSAIQVFTFGVLCFAASTQISYFISIIMTFCFFIAGSFSVFFLNHLADVAKKDAMLRLSGKVVEANYFRDFFNAYLEVACRISPQFDKYSHLESYLQNINIPAYSFFNVITYFLFYVIVYSIIGFVLLRKKEL